MTDVQFPQDIWDTAVKADQDGDEDNMVINHIANAILAERKRCASIADRFFQEYQAAGLTHPENSEPRDRCFARARAASNIEAAILSGEIP